MSFRVGYTFGGDVVILNEDGLRFDLSPDDARRLAEDIDRQSRRGGDIIFVTAQAKQGRAFRYAGNPDSAEQLSTDLRRAAAVGPTQPNEVST